VTKTVPGVSFTDPEPAFNPAGSRGRPETGDIPAICALTGMCPGGTYNPLSSDADIHPTRLGYGVLAGFVSADFLTPVARPSEMCTSAGAASPAEAHAPVNLSADTARRKGVRLAGHEGDVDIEGVVA